MGVVEIEMCYKRKTLTDFEKLELKDICKMVN